MSSAIFWFILVPFHSHITTLRVQKILAEINLPLYENVVLPDIINMKNAIEANDVLIMVNHLQEVTPFAFLLKYVFH